MSDAGSSTEGAPFSRGGVLALLVVGAGVLLALLYLLAIGDIGPQDGNDGGSHAGSQGINGYSALVELVEADGFETDVSRSPSELETSDILVLTPPGRMEPDELEAILDEREFRGPTLVILPKWNAFPPRFMGEVEDPDKIREGWVLLAGTSTPRWADEDSGPLALGIKPGGALAVEADAVEEASSPEAETAPRPNLQPRRFRTLGAIAGISGELPTANGVFADHKEPHFPIVVDGENRPIALALDSGRYEEPDIDSRPSHWIVFVVDPDLMNNWGIADPARARTALSIVRAMGTGGKGRVVFDMTLNGFGGTVNLLTLAFQPPFLAATICLLLAMFIIAWRAFLRFGP
ncbi:MAG: DUF4350 domain-containing protein, partial [Erythrobacter sp.]|nr:DUF4350 domain-containing protein [Erythrobacter sp.]